MNEIIKYIVGYIFVIGETAVNASVAFFLIAGTVALKDIANSLKSNKEEKK